LGHAQLARRGGLRIAHHELAHAPHQRRHLLEHGRHDAKVPAKLKLQLEQLFADVVLDTELGPWEPDAACELDHLKDRSFSLATDPEDRVRVQIRAMRFCTL
jgi:hypothetical protein